MSVSDRVREVLLVPRGAGGDLRRRGEGALPFPLPLFRFRVSALCAPCGALPVVRVSPSSARHGAPLATLSCAFPTNHSPALCRPGAQDRVLAQRIADDGRACVILLNKWDAVEQKDDKTYLR